MKKYPLVSVVIPFKNEEKHIQACISSLLNGGYSKDSIEFLLIDGRSDDASIERIRELDVAPADLKIINNPKSIVPTGMNIGIAEAKGEIILWAGAHALYSPKYIEISVELLIGQNAASVGGVIIPKGISRTGRAIAIAAKNPFGVGNAKYRYTDKAGWVDTVFGGCFRKKDIISIGGFNEDWVVNQDGELNYRLRSKIGGIYLSPEIKCQYFVRESYTALAKQYLRYGMWRAKTLINHMGSFTLRQAVAPMFVIAIIMLIAYSPVSLVPFILLLLVYSATGFLFIHKQYKRSISIIDVARVLAAFMTMHLNWGLGFIAGIAIVIWQRILSSFK